MDNFCQRVTLFSKNILKKLLDFFFKLKKSFFAGVFSRTSTAPLDRLKVLMQAQPKVSYILCYIR
jgi:hypothetical protein